jgi:hypothetical protein
MALDRLPKAALFTQSTTLTLHFNQKYLKISNFTRHRRDQIKNVATVLKMSFQIFDSILLKVRADVGCQRKAQLDHRQPFENNAKKKP